MNVENLVIIVRHVRALAITTTRRIKTPTRQRVIIPNVVELISLRKTNMKVVILLVQAQMIMNMQICA